MIKRKGSAIARARNELRDKEFVQEQVQEVIQAVTKVKAIEDYSKEEAKKKATEQKLKAEKLEKEKKAKAKTAGLEKEPDDDSEILINDTYGFFTYN